MDNITYEEFTKLDIRVGTVTKAEPVLKSDKLLRLEVWFGSDIGARIIVAGIAKFHHPSYLQGQQVTAIVNMAPRKLLNIESHGMILAGNVPASLDTPNAERVELVKCASVPDGGKIG